MDTGIGHYWGSVFYCFMYVNWQRLCNELLLLSLYEYKYSKVLARNYKDCDYFLCVGSHYAVYKELFIYTIIFECMDSFDFYLCSSTVGVLY